MNYHVKPFRNNTLEIMARTNKNEVHSEAPVTRLSTSRKISIDDQLESVRRLFNMLVAFCVGHLILSVVAATLFGVYISEHVRCSIKCLSKHFQNQKETKKHKPTSLYTVRIW